MSGAAKFTLEITALDAATATLRRVKREIASVVAPIGEIGSALRGVSKETGLTSVARHAFALRGTLLGVLSPLRLIGSLTAGLGVAGGIAGIFSVGGLIEMARGAAENAAALVEASEKTGVQVGMLARLHYAQKQVGGSTEELDKALGFLNKTIASAAINKAPMASGYFAAMHVNIRKSNGQLKSAADLFGEISDHFMHNANIAEKTGAARALFGRSGDQLLPLLDMGSKKTHQLGDEFDRLHGPFTKATGIAGKQAAEAWRRLDAATSGLKDSIGYALAPAITSVITPLTAWIAKNRELIATDVGQYARDLGNWLRSVNWKQVGKDAVAFVKDLKEAFHDMRIVFDGVKSSVQWLIDHWKYVHGLADIVTLGAFHGYESADRQQKDAQERTDAVEAAHIARAVIPAVRPRKPELLRRTIQAREILQSLGLSKLDASVLTGSGLWEGRGLNPAAVGDNGKSYGIMQWGPARQAEFLRVMHKSIVGSSMFDQLRFAVYELTKGKFRHVGDRFFAAQSDEEKAFIIDHDYEMPKDWRASFAQRLEAARVALAARSPAADDNRLAATGTPLTLPLFDKSIIGSWLRDQLGFARLALGVGAPDEDNRPAATGTPLTKPLFDNPVRDPAGDKTWAMVTKPLFDNRERGSAGDNAVLVNLNFDNLPKGTRVTSRSTGPLAPLLNTGVRFAPW